MRMTHYPRRMNSTPELGGSRGLARKLARGPSLRRRTGFCRQGRQGQWREMELEKKLGCERMFKPLKSMQKRASEVFFLATRITGDCHRLSDGVMSPAWRSSVTFF